MRFDVSSERACAVVMSRARSVDDGVLRVEAGRLEPLGAVEEAEAVELLAALFAAMARRRGAQPEQRAA
jgi:hypothetical protein